MQNPAFAIARGIPDGMGILASNWFWVRNAFEFLDSAGEFYFDRTKDTLFY
jgi:hypothetical protein